MERISFLKGEGDFFSRIARRSRYSALNEEEQLAYDRWLKFENDRILELEYSRREARAEGIAEGRAEGRAEGIAEGRTEGRAEGRAEGIWDVARNLHSMGLSLSQIAEATKIPIDQLRTRFNLN